MPLDSIYYIKREGNYFPPHVNRNTENALHSSSTRNAETCAVSEGTFLGAAERVFGETPFFA